MNEMAIVQAERKDCELLASIISKSNKDVAELFDLNINIAPKHPSFCTPEWISADFDRGQQYFLFKDNGISKGCVAIEQPNDETAYLNRLSVLPEFRNKGIGSTLVHHVIEFSKDKNVINISIGIIAEHEELKRWYSNHQFKLGSLQKFDHLPFNVLFMHYEI